MKVSDMHRYRLVLTIFVFLLFPLLAMSQTPIANRVRAKAARMKNRDRIVAKYTDDRRHCLYFVRSNRLFRYDALTGATSEVVFSTQGYNKIINTWLSRDGNVVFVLVDRSALTSQPLADGQEVYSVNSFTGKSTSIGSGVHCVMAHEGYFYITHLVAVKRRPNMTKEYIVEDQWFYDDGRPLWVKDRRTWKK